MGFAWRHSPLARLRDNLKLEDIWILWDKDHPVGYALAQVNKGILTISDLLLRSGIEAAEAVAAVSADHKTSYVQVKVSARHLFGIGTDRFLISWLDVT